MYSDVIESRTEFVQELPSFEDMRKEIISIIGKENSSGGEMASNNVINFMIANIMCRPTYRPTQV